MTHQQRRLLAFISNYVQESGGVSPTYTEMANYLGLKAKSGVNRVVVALDSRGLIGRLAGKQRSIYVTDAGAALLRGDQGVIAGEMRD